ncbi:MAG: sulfatase [Planctomycetaceae bacterium]
MPTVLNLVPTRLLLLALPVMALLALPMRTVSLAAAERPNILWLIAEDFGPDLSCYGTPEVRTPNIDSLAREGVRFTHAYTTTPVCSTSRSSFMTGMYATTIGAHNHRSHRDGQHPLPDGVRLMTDWLRDAGYFTANIRQFPAGVDLKGTGKTDWNFSHARRPFDSDRWKPLSSHQPFYAQVNFPETHRGKEWDQAHEHVETRADPAKVVFPPYYPDHPITRADYAQYLNAAMALDHKVGVVLEQLKSAGLWDTTIVVFMADHGQAMVRGKQWPYESGLHIPLIIRWPQGIRAPAEFLPGTTSEELVMSIDLTATTLDWAGVAPPPRMQGRVFWGERAPPDRKFVFGGRDRGDETVDRVRTVRDERYRYLKNFYPDRPFTQLNRYKEVSYPVLRLMHRLHDSGELARTNPHAERLMAPTRPDEELYDLQNDPYELTNLASDPAYEETLQRLRGELDRWLVESDDQGRFPEDPAIIAEQNRQMSKAYDERLRKLRAEER